jgi:tetratricopeptide (TPR) repeat protein
MLAERAKSFGSTAQALLEVLAVAGRPTPVAVAVRAGAADDPHRAVDVLRNARMLRESGKRNYECYHDRIAAAVRASLPEGAVQRYHRELATAWANRPDADPEVLFGHWLAAGEPQLAGTYAVRAADKAAASLAFERCATFLGHALEALPNAEVEASDLQARRAHALSLAGRWSDAAHAFGQASDACKQPERSAELQLQAATHYLGSGHGDQGLPRLAKLLEEAGIPWPRSRVLALASACARLTWLWLRGASAHNLPTVTAQQSEETAGPSPYGNILDRWLVGAGLVPAYDFARGIYFMSVFSARGLRSAEPGRRALALGMLAALFGGTRAGRARARALSDQAVALAHTAGSYPVLASTALSFVAYTRLQSGSLLDALQLGQEAEHLLDAEGQAHAASAWAARAAQAHALFAMGRLGDAAQIFERSARIALQSGDDLALLGGDSVMRKLVVDDLDGAHALLDRKERLLARMPSRGVLQELTKSERMLCALYEGQGEVALGHADRRTVLHALLDPGTLPACAALQVDPAGKQLRTRRLVRRAVRRLRAQGELAASQATAWQLTAALRLFDHDLRGACDALAAAHEQYQKSDMAMHAALMRLRLSGLQRALGTATPQAEQTASDDALRLLREQGATRPEAWVQMLAPGLAAPAG